MRHTHYFEVSKTHLTDNGMDDTVFTNLRNTIDNTKVMLRDTTIFEKTWAHNPHTCETCGAKYTKIEALARIADPDIYPQDE